MMVLLSHFFVLYSVPFLRIAASFEVASFYLHVCRTTVAMETNFPPFCFPLSILSKSHGYDDIQTSNEFLLIFTINTTYTPNIFTGEWVKLKFRERDHYSTSIEP